METTLLISLFACHFLADFTHLSTNDMLAAKRLGKPLYPIFVHASVHYLLMTVVMIVVAGVWVECLLAGALQLVTHFLIDVWKGRMNAWYPSLQSPGNKWHWWLFGFDQFLHTVVIILMVKILTA